MTPRARRGAAALRPGTAIVLIGVDFTSWRYVADWWGFPRADAAMAEFVHRVVTEAGGRLAQDSGMRSIAIVVPEGEEAADALAARIREAVRDLADDLGINVPGHPFVIGAGVAMADAGDTTATLLLRADRALAETLPSARCAPVVLIP